MTSSGRLSNKGDRPNVTVLGAGTMGSAAVRALLSSGCGVTVWNRSPARVAPLAAVGARTAASIGDALAEPAPDVTLVSVLDYPAVREVLGAAGERLAGRVLVNLTTGSPEQARAMADWAGEREAAYLDGAVMATAAGVGRPKTLFLYSGSRRAWEAALPVLRLLGEPQDLGPDAGRAALFETALLDVMWASLTGWLHGAALVGSEGTTATEFTPLVVRWLEEVSGLLHLYAPQVDQGVYPGTDSTLHLHASAIAHLLEASERRGVDTRLVKLYEELTAAAIRSGHRGDGFASLIEQLRAPGPAHRPE